MFAARFVTGIVLLALFGGALFLLPNAYWSALLLLALHFAALEWAALAGYRRVARWAFAAAVLGAGVALLLHGYRTTPTMPNSSPLYVSVYWVAAVFWIVIAPAWLMKQWRPRNGLILGIAGVIVLVPTWLALVVLQATPTQLIVVLGVVWIADTAAYLVGRRLGKHALAPRISPGKTWEGLIGAVAAVAVYFSLLWFIFAAERSPRDAAIGVALFAAVTALSVEGDLFESWMKRQAGMKDSGALLPGHGGVLDRIDGLTASLPIAALWLHYLHAAGVPA
ncbi:MAG: phosphatidate cytidylyltransferase [Betaproteobacteria bacterium]